MPQSSSLTPSFNLDILFEILSRSSLQTLSTCRLLSSDCNSLTYESLFRQLHYHRTSIVSGFFIQFMEHSKFYSQFVSMVDNVALSLDFLPCRVEIVASANTGILLCVNKEPKIPEYYVCKPTVQTFRKIPNPKTRYFTVATGMVLIKSSPLRFKIVRMSKPKSCRYEHLNYNYYRTEIFDSETWSWKRVEDVTLPFGSTPAQGLPITIGGSLYWQVTDHSTVVAYHQEDNCCSTFSLPDEVVNNSCARLVEYEGKLGGVCQNKEGMTELWLKKNNVEKIWLKSLRVNCKEVMDKGSHASFLNFYGNDVALFNAAFKLMFYKLKKKKRTNIVRIGTMCKVEAFHLQLDYEYEDFKTKPFNFVSS